jgi:hypothetical protein
MTPEKPKKFLRLPEIIGPGGRIPVSRSTWYRASLLDCILRL